MKQVNSLIRFLKDFERGIRSRATDYLAYELRELENIFCLLLLGSLVGLPSPPSSLSLRLMPYLIPEMYVVGGKAGDMADISGEAFGALAREGCCRKASFLVSWWQRRRPLGFG